MRNSLKRAAVKGAAERSLVSKAPKRLTGLVMPAREKLKFVTEFCQRPLKKRSTVPPGGLKIPTMWNGKSMATLPASSRLTVALGPKYRKKVFWPPDRAVN